MSNTWDMNLRASGCLNAVIARALKRSWSNITSDTSLSMAAMRGRLAPNLFRYHLTPETDNSEYKKTGLSTYSPYRVKDRSMGFLAQYHGQPAVWSKDYGYPGFAYYGIFINSSGSGLKYWRVTRRDINPECKLVYDRHQAQETVKRHAAHFMDTIEGIAREADRLGYSEPLIVACYDTELFGHWWWEG